MKALRGLGYYAAFCAGLCTGIGEFAVAYGCAAMLGLYVACDAALEHAR